MTQRFSPLDTRLAGSFFTRFWLELFGNSAHFPIANILLELLLEGPDEYLGAPDLYVIVSASLIQAYWLTRWQSSTLPRRFLGNMIGPAVYTVIESLIEGASFFAAPHHLAYLGFACAVGALQEARIRTAQLYGNTFVVAESIVRTSILFFMYAVFETHGATAQPFSLAAFFSDDSHRFIGLAVLFLGLSIGLANLTAERYLARLRETSTQLRTYSEWLLGRDLLGQTFADPESLSLTRRERTVLFMDIRGFTRWSGDQSPEAVVDLLNRYYQTAESILTRHHSIKIKLSADEVMAVFPNADTACRAALALSESIERLLTQHDLGAGIGLHAGPLVEGLLGSAGVRFYDVIGDTVNTAKRIESAAERAEVLVSEHVRESCGPGFRISERRTIVAKGKEHPIPVYRLAPQTDAIGTPA